jgi:hypothetical protein
MRSLARAEALRAPGVCVVLAAAACAGHDAERDAVGPSQDVVVSAPARSSEGYEYVARRPFAVVALAEARGIDRDAARAAVEHLADALDVCTTEAARTSSLPSGAARVIAQINAAGTVETTQLRVDPAARGASSAFLCLVRPVRQLAFAPSDAGARGLAIEALWGQPTSTGN